MKNRNFKIIFTLFLLLLLSINVFGQIKKTKIGFNVGFNTNTNSIRGLRSFGKNAGFSFNYKINEAYSLSIQPSYSKIREYVKGATFDNDLIKSKMFYVPYYDIWDFPVLLNYKFLQTQKKNFYILSGVSIAYNNYKGIITSYKSACACNSVSTSTSEPIFNKSFTFNLKNGIGLIVESTEKKEMNVELVFQKAITPATRFYSEIDLLLDDTYYTSYTIDKNIYLNNLSLKLNYYFK